MTSHAWRLLAGRDMTYVIYMAQHGRALRSYYMSYMYVMVVIGMYVMVVIGRNVRIVYVRGVDIFHMDTIVMVVEA